jgi:hypothetical protein
LVVEAQRKLDKARGDLERSRSNAAAALVAAASGRDASDRGTTKAARASEVEAADALEASPPLVGCRAGSNLDQDVRLATEE